MTDTTDDFTAAARAEAERRWSPRESDRLPMDWLDEGMGSGFVLGALWARTHIGQEPTDAEHRIARLEAQTDIRGRAVAICQRRAREAEAERDCRRRENAELRDELVATQEYGAKLAHGKDEAEERIEAVRELHRPVDVEPSDTICAACSTLRGSGESLRYFPTEEWPCATIQALDAARAARRDEEKR